MGVFIQVENGIHCLAANDKAQGGLGFFLFGSLGGRFFGNRFSLCSHQVLNMFPIISHFVLPWLNMNINCKGGAEGKHDKACFYLGEGSILN